MRDKACPRRAAVLAMVLVCLAVCSAIIVALLSAGARQRQLVDLEKRRSQARWLVEAGIERAAARLAADLAYTGEDWQLTRDELALPSRATAGRESDAAALVHIEVRRPAETSALRIFVRADVPPDDPRRARQEHTVLWTPQPGDQP